MRSEYNASYTIYLPNTYLKFFQLKIADNKKSLG